MNRKKNTTIILVLIIIILIMILIAGGVFAYIKTDIFKSNKELFFKYITQIADTKNGLIDENVAKYYEKQQTTAYTDEGKITFNITSQEDQEKYENTNNLNISFTGKVDIANSKSEQDIKLNYSNTVNFPILYRQIENTIGIQTDYIGSKFVSVETDKLGNLLGESGISASNINSVKEIQGIFGKELTKEDQTQIQKRYVDILNQELSKEKFSKEKVDNSNAYKLTLTGEELKNVIVKLLEALKEDQTMLDKINEYQKTNENSKTITAHDIENIIESVNDSTQLDDQNIEITVYSSKGKTNGIAIKNNTTKIDIQKASSSNEAKYQISIEQTEDEETSKMTLSLNYSGLKEMQNIEETYELGIENSQPQYKYLYKFNNNTQFAQSVEIEDLTSNNSILLTDYENEQVTNFLTAVGERFSEVNKEQMEELGLSEYENPIQYLIPVAPLLNSSVSNSPVLNSSSSFSQNSLSDLSEEEINTFNQKFEVYTSTNLQGVTIKGLLSTISLSNEQQDEDRQIKEINFDGKEYEASEQNITFIKEDVDIQKNYRVEFEKDQDTGLINRAIISVK